MTSEEFQQWWNNRVIALTAHAVRELEGLHCQDAEVAATGLIDRLEEYLRSTYERYDAAGLPQLCSTAITRRARNHMRNSIRKHGPHVAVSLDTILDNPEAFSTLLQRAELSCTMDTDVMQQQHVRLTLAALTLKDRDLLLCTIVEGWTVEEVSKHMGYAHRTGAQAAISRAKQRFRTIWEQKGYGGGSAPVGAVSSR